MKAARKPSGTNASGIGVGPLAQEHEFEAARGLPEALPRGEALLWQGSPDWKSLAARAFHVRKLVVYFAALIALRVVMLVGEGAGVGTMAISVLWMLLLSCTALALLSFTAWLSARATVYTITDKRVVMRIGIVLTLTFNIPFVRIAAAGLHVDKNGTGDLPLTLSGEDRIAWLHLWPHARPWRLKQPEPMLRSVPQAAEVARVLATAWSRATGVDLQANVAERPATAAGARHPALATR